MNPKKGEQFRGQDIIQKMMGKTKRTMKRKMSPMEVTIKQSGQN